MEPRSASGSFHFAVLDSRRHADHHDAVGVDIHRQLELVTLARRPKTGGTPPAIRLITYRAKNPGKMRATRHLSKFNVVVSLAFRRLGARAEVAVPALIEIYELKLSASSQQTTARSLGVIGPPAKRAIPLLIRGMAGTNALLRCDTVQALADFHAEPKLVVPALTNALNDTEYSIDGKAEVEDFAGI